MSNNTLIAISIVALFLSGTTKIYLDYKKETSISKKYLDSLLIELSDEKDLSFKLYKAWKLEALKLDTSDSTTAQFILNNSK